MAAPPPISPWVRSRDGKIFLCLARHAHDGAKVMEVEVGIAAALGIIADLAKALMRQTAEK